MRRSITRVLVRPSAHLIAAAIVCAAVAGCGKEAGPAQGTPAVKESAQAALEGAEPQPSKAQGAPPVAVAAASADPAAASDPAKPADPAKPDVARNAVAARPSEPAAVGAAPAAPPAAAPPADAPAPPPEAPAAPPAAPPTAEAAPAITSPKIGESNFSVWMQAGKVKAGQPSTVEVVLVPKNGFHCNENYPYKIKMADPPAGVSFPSPIVRKEGMSVTPSRGVMRVPFVASTAGDARIAGKFSFSVCTTDQCLIDSRDVSITVKVE